MLLTHFKLVNVEKLNRVSIIRSITSVCPSSLRVFSGGDEAALWPGPLSEKSIQRIPQRILWQTRGRCPLPPFAVRPHDASAKPSQTDDDSYECLGEKGPSPGWCYTAFPLVLEFLEHDGSLKNVFQEDGAPVTIYYPTTELVNSCL